MLIFCILSLSVFTSFAKGDLTIDEGRTDLFLTATDSVCEFPRKEVIRSKDFRVGLVLSGGGAKGIAHAGVIKALEENDIPIDCVAGTSMGAIVGSLYACGYSPEEMMSLFTSEGFKYWSSGTIDKKLVYYETQEIETPELLDINLSFKKSNSDITSQIIPANLISPIPMNIEFLKLYGPYTEQCNGNFNNLFVPLRTVCSDVYHKHKIVCYEGLLGDAVRASMSFPLVFKPIELDGVLVYDGGIYDNFPVDVMHEDFNPDFIIGVSVSGPDSKPEPGNIYSQLEDMIIQNNDYNLPADLGVKIQVPVLDFGVLDWGEAKTIYEIGYKTGLGMVDSIKSRCKSRESLSEVNERRAEFKKMTPELKFDSIDVKGTDKHQASYLVNLFRGGKPFGEINMQQVENAYYQAVTDGKLADLLPQAIIRNDGKNTLVLDAKVKKPWNVGVGGWVTSSTQSQLFLTFGYHTLTFHSLNVDIRGWIGQSYYAAMLSGRISLPSAVPSSLMLSGVVSKQKYYESELMFYQENTPCFINETQQYVRLEYSLAAGKPSKLYTSLSIGRLLDDYYADKQMMTGKRDRSEYKGVAWKIGYEKNTLGDPLYPMSGELMKANLIALYEKMRFEQERKNHFNVSAEFLWKNFYPLHANFKMGFMGNALATFEKLYQNYTATLIHSPAFAPTPSTENYFNEAFRSQNYVAVGVIPIWNPFTKFQIRGDFYCYSPIRNLVQTSSGCKYDGWFRKTEFIGEIAAVYNFNFASLSLYCNYLSYPARNWNFGLNFGLLFQAPKFTR